MPAQGSLPASSWLADGEAASEELAEEMPLVLHKPLKPAEVGEAEADGGDEEPGEWLESADDKEEAEEAFAWCCCFEAKCCCCCRW